MSYSPSPTGAKHVLVYLRQKTTLFASVAVRPGLDADKMDRAASFCMATGKGK